MNSSEFLQKAIQLRLREGMQGLGFPESTLRLLRFSGVDSIQEFAIDASAASLAFSSQRTLIESKRKMEGGSTIADADIKDIKVGMVRAAYQQYKVMLVNIFRGLRGILTDLSKNNVLDIDKEFAKYLEQSRLEAVRGEQRISIEEKQLYQLIVYGSLFPSALDLPLATKIIELGVDTICYGYIVELVDMSYLEQYKKSLSEFVPLYNSTMQKLVAEMSRWIGPPIVHP